MMWTRLPLLECFEYVQELKMRLGTRNFNDNANFLFAITTFIFVLYIIFYRVSKVIKCLILCAIASLKNSYHFRNSSRHQKSHKQSIVNRSNLHSTFSSSSAPLRSWSCITTTSFTRSSVVKQESGFRSGRACCSINPAILWSLRLWLSSWAVFMSSELFWIFTRAMSRTQSQMYFTPACCWLATFMDMKTSRSFWALTWDSSTCSPISCRFLHSTQTKIKSWCFECLPRSKPLAGLTSSWTSCLSNTWSQRFTPKTSN